MMKQKELTKTSMMFSNLKKPLVSMAHTKIFQRSRLRAKGDSIIIVNIKFDHSHAGVMQRITCSSYGAITKKHHL